MLIVFSCLIFSAHSQDSLKTNSKFKNKGFVDFNGYYDTREFSALTTNILVNMKHRFQYFSLTNFESSTASADFSKFYSEQNLRWKPVSKIPIDIFTQWVIRSGAGADDLRFGLKWNISKTKILDQFFNKINMFYFVNFHLIQFRNKVNTKGLTQLEHVYNFKILPKLFKSRVYLGGFADQNIVYQENGKISFNWVSEHQLGIRFYKKFFAVLEYRINDFLPADNYGLGYGLEYKINF